MIINPGLPTQSTYYTRSEIRIAERDALVLERNKELLLGKLREKMHELAPHAALGDRVHNRMKGSLDAFWTCGDGKRVRVSEMNDAHLFFALAKGFRNEYPDSKSRETGVEALKAEALRRLAKGIL